ncbi:MAG: exonuclease [Fibrobacter sp.]|nr:exonuclease [Fibrobacter sp.]
MCWVSVDVEADGPVPGDYSMVMFGAVIVKPGLEKIFRARLRPISERWSSSSLAVCGFSRDETYSFDMPSKVMAGFREWLYSEGGKHLFFVSDNGFDWQYINWYFHHFLGENPFGYSTTNIRSLYAGVVKDVYRRYRSNRKRKVHDPVEDALYNAEMLMKLKDDYGLRINW